MILFTIATILVPTFFIFRFIINLFITIFLFILFSIHGTITSLYPELKSFRLWAEFSHWKKRENSDTNTKKAIKQWFEQRKNLLYPSQLAPEYLFAIWTPIPRNRHNEIKTCHSLPTLHCVPHSLLPPNRDFFTWVWVPHPNFDICYKWEFTDTELIFFLG